MSGTTETAHRANSRPKNNVTQKPMMEIKIDQHFKAKVYTSGSTIAGHVAIRTTRDMPFDGFDIVFTGMASTRLEFVQQYPAHSFRPFMKLRMPLSESDFPTDRVFRAGQDYRIPFNFVVPHQLTIGACNHNCLSPAVREQHLRLPPSLGFWDADDQAPDMTQIEYAVKARATRSAHGGSQAVKLMQGDHILKVLPSLPEDAPLDITFRDAQYKLSKTKTIRKSLFSSKTGQVTATATQPGAVMLSADGHKTSTTSVHIDLEYVPSSVETAPPKVNSVTGKLISTTFFGAVPTDHLPNLGSRTNYETTPCLSYLTTNSLFTLPIDKVSWVQQNVSSPRRDSGYSSTLADGDASETDGSEGRGRHGTRRKSSKKAKRSPIKHTTDLDIPFTLPNSNKKFFLPTFHSCLISRTYTLQLSLSVGPTSTAISLAIPLQVGVEAMYEPQGGELPSFESVMAQVEEEQAEAHLQPRVMHIPDPGLQSNSLLPGYEDLRQRTVLV